MLTTENPLTTYQFDPAMVVAANDFYAENLTIDNPSGDHGQALALRVDADRAVFKHCRIVGWQDTLMVNSGRQYFTNCYIAGRVDFIYGSGTAVFDHCEIHSRNGGHADGGQYAGESPSVWICFSKLPISRATRSRGSIRPTRPPHPRNRMLNWAGRPAAIRQRGASQLAKWMPLHRS